MARRDPKVIDLGALEGATHRLDHRVLLVSTEHNDAAAGDVLHLRQSRARHASQFGDDGFRRLCGALGEQDGRLRQLLLLPPKPHDLPSH